MSLFAFLPTAAGQKVATPSSVITAQVGHRHTTGAPRHLRDATCTRLARRKRILAESQTSEIAAAP